MGCCQTNLASPNHPANINPRNFIDRIKEDGSLEGNGRNKKNNKKKTQSEEEYEYSVHGLIEGEEDEESQVSIFDEKRKLSSGEMSGEGRRKMGHVEIHPEVVGEKQQEKVEKNVSPSVQQVTVNKNNNKNSFQPLNQQLPISRIQLSPPSYNLSHHSTHILNKKITSSSLLHQNNTLNHRSLNQKDTCKDNYNLSDRELVELNEEIATMIVMWDKGKGQGKRLRLGTMRNEGDQEGVEDRDEADGEIDRELQEIWNEEQKEKDVKNENNKLQLQEQVNNTQDKLKNLKNQYILQTNLNQPQTNKPTKQQCLLTNQKLKQKLQQQPSQKVQNLQQPQKQNHQNLKLHLSKMKSRAQQRQTPNVFNTHQHQDQSQNQSQDDDEFSQCLLSNPTKILNDSFVEEFSQQKEMFYFGGKKSQKKWIQSDRKAFQVNKVVIEMFLFGNHNNQHNHNLLSPQENQNTITKSTKKPTNNPLTTPFCILLSIIRDYHQLTGINLIAYRTFSSTSIFFEPHQRQNNYSGFRIFYNGTKRIYPFSECFDCTQIGVQLWKMVGRLYEKERSLAEVIYNLTGWVPEFIVVEEINSFQGIFERLNNNFVQGNTIITFSGKRGEVWGLKSINLERKQIKLYGKFVTSQDSYKHIHQFEQTHPWQQFTKMITSINVNWNPLIYQYIWKSQNIFFSHQSQSQNKIKDTIPQHDPTYISYKSHQYLLKIPPSDEDIELRVFLETHFNDMVIMNSESQPLVVQLYDYMGHRVHTLTHAIRKIDRKKAVYSDVLIFEGPRERTQYVLMVRPEVPSYGHQVKYTISAYSFFEVGLSELAQQRVIEEKKITTFLQQSHCGYGINSPYFLDNFYMQLKVPSNERVRIFVEMPSNQCCFQINLIANPQGQQNLTRLNLQTILNDTITSEEFNHGKGYLQLQTKHSEYFLMLTNHTKCKGQFKIIIQVLEKQSKALTKVKLQQIQIVNSNKDQFMPKMISYKERFFYQQPLVKKEFKWSPINTGPRKRLKSNTHSGYQPYVTFKDFFKNPSTDFKLQAGKKYQFSVVSQSFKQQFNQILQQDDKNDSQPPTLSLGILKIAKPDDYNNNNEKGNESVWSFKIVLDDAFYVPFGFGFWTKAMKFEEGDYRFVFPRMEKESGVGVFCIYEAGV